VTSQDPPEKRPTRYASRRSRLVHSTPFYYGWVIVALGATGGVMTNPGQTPGFSAFLNHFIEDLGLSRSIVSTLYTAATLTASLFLPWVGRLFDRRGSRFMICLFSLLLGLACIYMSLVRNAVMLFFGFVVLRQFGQGSLTLASKNVINLWWVRRRGRIMGIVGVVGALLSGLFPYLANTLIDQHGWRWTYVILGGILLGVMLPLGYIFARDRPEDHGLLPDGAGLKPDDDNPTSQSAESATSDQDSSPPKRAESTSEPLEVNWTLAQAKQSTAFWVTCAAMSCVAMLNTGLYFHIFSVFEDGGLSASTAATVFVPIAATSAAFQLITGLVIGRIPPRFLLAASLFMESAVLISATHLSSVTHAYAFGIFWGIQSGIEMLVMGVIFANYYGRQHLGAIAGFSSTLLVAASALGPMPFGIARDLMGGYGPVLTTMAILPFSLAFACLFFGKPADRPPEDS
jgi:MFS transporter, OFA family, oxalate/formate antiporter